MQRRSEKSPLSIGVDVIRVAEVAASIDRFGDRYIKTLYTEKEAAYCGAAAKPVAAARFAARFAAKEAVIKALHPGRRWIDWRSIEVRRCRSGNCVIDLHGDAASLAVRRGIHHFALSMTHEDDIAAAVVVAIRDSRRGEH